VEQEKKALFSGFGTEDPPAEMRRVWRVGKAACCLVLRGPGQGQAAEVQHEKDSEVCPDLTKKQRLEEKGMQEEAMS
jgi:hypothetical protein